MNDENHRERQLRHLKQRHERLNQAFEQRHAAMRRKLSDKQEVIITAALKLLDEDGINELSLRKLAREVHVQAPALYWYFKNKEDLIDYLAEAILAPNIKKLAVRDEDESWQEWLIAACKTLRNAMLAHRDGARVVAGAHLYPAVSLVQFFELATQSLESAGVSEKQAELYISTAVHFTFGRVIEEQSMPDPSEYDATQVETFFSEFPHFKRAVGRALHDESNSSDEFDASLRLMIH